MTHHRRKRPRAGTNLWTAPLDTSTSPFDFTPDRLPDLLADFVDSPLPQSVGAEFRTPITEETLRSRL